MNAKILVFVFFVICVEAIICFILYNVHDCTFRGPIIWRSSAHAEISVHLNGLKIKLGILINNSSLIIKTELQLYGKNFVLRRAEISHILNFKFHSGLIKVRIKTKFKMAEKRQLSHHMQKKALRKT